MDGGGENWIIIKTKTKQTKLIKKMRFWGENFHKLNKTIVREEENIPA